LGKLKGEKPYLRMCLRTKVYTSRRYNLAGLYDGTHHFVNEEAWKKVGDDIICFVARILTPLKDGRRLDLTCMNGGGSRTAAYL
jgi:hypothetical protein